MAALRFFLAPLHYFLEQSIFSVLLFDLLELKLFVVPFTVVAVIDQGFSKFPFPDLRRFFYFQAYLLVFLLVKFNPFILLLFYGLQFIEYLHPHFFSLSTFESLSKLLTFT